ncbi:hypothetical protein FOC84_27770 [Achromobacter pestifer]|uniref:Uncharacterized protein n=1 Tax=Achromobacter pestifer TaxID=1353889 RepID=A0A7D4EA50_9BURK|nr:hypothetical protein [Achromobacter pestifer]QKH38526.1 hypothetical protein FOC84_27770 [Achromobacter pestifer]
MWIKALTRWSQTAYGLVHSVTISSKIDLGNINRIGSSITDAFGWLPRQDQFDSNVEHRPYKEDDFRLNDGDVSAVVLNLKANLLSLLLVDLAALTDELLSSIMQAKGKNPETYPYLRNKTRNVTCAPEQEWARRGVLELNVIRNCIVHNDGKWSDRGLKDIAPLVKNLVAKNGDRVEVNFEDVFRYKRAVRTLLNQAEIKGFAP